MHNIFLLEDSEYRIDWFKRRFSSKNNLIIAKSVDEAKVLFDFDIAYAAIFLDHDLCDEHYNLPVSSHTVPNGHDFAKHLAMNKDKVKAKQIIVHSMNPIGATNIYVTLRILPNVEEIHNIPYNLLIGLFS